MTDQAMVEKVARALCQVVARCDDDCEGCDCWPNFKPPAEKMIALVKPWLVPAGFGVRRREPTQEMIAAGWIDKDDVDPDDIWIAMYDEPSASPDGANEKGER